MELFQISARRKADWPKRIQRAAELADNHAYAREILRFYQSILEFQRGIFDSIPPTATNAPPLPLDANTI